MVFITAMEILRQDRIYLWLALNLQVAEDDLEPRFFLHLLQASIIGACHNAQI